MTVREGWSQRPFPETLTDLMEQKGMTYRALSVASGLSAGYLCHLAMGARPVPSDLVLWRIGKAVGVPAEFFLEFRIRRVVARLPRDIELVNRLYEKCRVAAG